LEAAEELEAVSYLAFGRSITSSKEGSLSLFGDGDISGRAFLGDS
jgi:hypothetical protein